MPNLSVSVILPRYLAGLTWNPDSAKVVSHPCGQRIVGIQANTGHWLEPSESLMRILERGNRVSTGLEEGVSDQSPGRSIS